MNIIKILFFPCIFVVISACSTSPTIHSDFNRTIDFNYYKSFGFFDQLDTDRGYESLISQHLKEATIAEMTIRGFVFVKDTPDLLINFHTNVERKQVVHERPVSYHSGGYYGYRKRWYYNAWPEYEVYVDSYDEGTLNIDMVDRQSNKMIWEGLAIGRLSEKEKQNIRPVLQKAVRDIFIQFPILIEDNTK